MADVSYYLSLPYTKILKRDEDNDVIATIAELDGCMAHGSDEAEALQNLAAAQADWLEAALEAGQDIPTPELEDELPSGKFVVRLPRSLHLKLNKIAKKDDVSLNQVMLMAVTEHVTRSETRPEALLKADHGQWKWKTTGHIDWQLPPKKLNDSYLNVITARGRLSEKASSYADDHVYQVPVRRRA